MQPAFSGAALPRGTSVRTGRHVTPKCTLAIVEEKFPTYRQNKAPVITFNGNLGIRLSMERIGAFTEVDEDTPPLLNYADPDVFIPNKPVPPSAISWPSGDGRGMKLSGSKSRFTRPNLKTYGPFPDFFKVC